MHLCWAVIEFAVFALAKATAVVVTTSKDIARLLAKSQGQDGETIAATSARQWRPFEQQSNNNFHKRPPQGRVRGLRCFPIFKLGLKLIGSWGYEAAEAEAMVAISNRKLIRGSS